jgi:hypothetical protein
MGLASVASRVRDLDEPVVLAGRSFTSSCDLGIESLAEPLDGLELGPVIPKLQTFHEAFWPNALRKPIVHLKATDAALLVRGFRPFARHPDEVMSGWIDRAAPRRPNLAKW